MRKKLLIASPIFLALATIAFFGVRASRNSIIVSSGVVAANTWGMLTGILLAIAILAFVVITIVCLIKPVLSNLAEKTRAKNSKVTLSYNRALKSDDVRERLLRHKDKHPSLSSLIDSCIKQISSIKERQASLAEIISLNGADFLSDAPNALDESKQMILRNLMWVVNRGISVTTNDEDYEDDQEFERLIVKVLAANKNVLSECQNLLTWASDFISSKGTDAGLVSETKLFTEAIRRQIRQSSFTTEDDKGN